MKPVFEFRVEILPLAQAPPGRAGRRMSAPR
jgi:hypothetical protein